MRSSLPLLAAALGTAVVLACSSSSSSAPGAPSDGGASSSSSGSGICVGLDGGPCSTFDPDADGGTDAGEDTSPGTFGAACTADATCGDGGYCLFATSAGCQASGICYVPSPSTAQPGCVATYPGCACGGGAAQVPCAAPEGYTSEPVPAPLGSFCTGVVDGGQGDGGDDAGALDASQGASDGG